MRPRVPRWAWVLGVLALGACLSEDRPPPEVFTDFESRARLADGGQDAANNAPDAADGD
ncbi:MAG: hypothetical protein HY909_24850 [Deltaproteobacteria bacterium]|nr:hypothetical protein [Deltaproteobacteria bacterium]